MVENGTNGHNGRMTPTKQEGNADSGLMELVFGAHGVDNPQNWPLYKRVHASLAGFAMTFAVYVSLGLLFKSFQQLTAVLGALVLPDTRLD